MSHQIKTSLLALLCLAFIACTSSAPETPKKTTIEAPAPESQTEPIKISGTTIIKFTIPMGTSAAFQLLQSTKQNNDWDYVTSIKFNDENCSTGHQASVTFKKNAGVHYTNYFHKEAQWLKVNTLTLSWGRTQKHLIASLNDEKIELQTDMLMRFLKITSAPGEIDIHSIEHLQEQGSPL